MQVKEFLTDFFNDMKVSDFKEFLLEKHPILEDYEMEYIIKNKGEDFLQNIYNEYEIKLQELINSLYTMTPAENKDKLVIFFVNQYDYMFKDGKNYDSDFIISSFACKKDKIIENALKGISIWDGENRLEHYGYDFSSREEILGMDMFLDTNEISEIDAAITLIKNMTSFSIDEETRNEKIENVIADLEKSLKDYEEHKDEPGYLLDAEEVFENILGKHMSVEDRKERTLKLKEREKNKEKIHARMHIGNDINHKKCIIEIEKYYLSIVDELVF